MNFIDGSATKVHDVVDRMTANKDLGKTWTGRTEFRVATVPVQKKAGRTRDRYEIFLADGEVENFEREVLKGGFEPGSISPEAEVLISEVGSLAKHAVPDTACRKTPLESTRCRG